MFGSKKIDPAEAERRKQAEVEALVAAAEVEALAKSSVILAEAVTEHGCDCSGYKFECRRWGDFLSLFIERLVISKSSSRLYLPKTYATAVNIRETRELKLVEGHGPDCNGSLTYHVSFTTTDGGYYLSVGGIPTAPKEYKCDVRPAYPRTNPYRPLFALDTIEHAGGGYDYDGHRAPHATRNYPRVARDDRIRFEGIGATLFAPAGLGASIYEKVLREIGDHSA